RLVALDVDDEARGVPPVAPVAIPRARARPPHPVERDVHPLDVTLRRRSTFCAHADRTTERHRQRAGIRLSDRWTRGRAARPLSAWLPRHGTHVALPRARTGGVGLPGCGA